LPSASATGPSLHPVAALAAAARRLAAIDPSRAGVGGLRLQLELALFPDPALAPRADRSAMPAAVAVTPAEPDRPKAAPAGPAAQRNPRATGAAKPDAPAPDAPEAAAAPAATSGARQATPPEPAAPSASGPAAVDTSPAAGDLGVLRDRWPEIVARISAHPPTKPLIVVCRPISVEEGVVTLGFPEDKSFLRAVAERRRGVLEENISAVLGRSVAVRCVATNIDVVPDLPSDEEAAWILAEARRIFGEEGADPAEVG
jgi:hypothetical protein